MLEEYQVNTVNRQVEQMYLVVKDIRYISTSQYDT